MESLSGVLHWNLTSSKARFSGRFGMLWSSARSDFWFFQRFKRKIIIFRNMWITLQALQNKLLSLENLLSATILSFIFVGYADTIVEFGENKSHKNCRAWTRLMMLLVLCVISSAEMIGQFFFLDTSGNMTIVTGVLPKDTEFDYCATTSDGNDLANFFFQQQEVSPLIARVISWTSNFLTDILDKVALSNSLRSRYHTHCEFCLWDYMKSKVYAN